MVEPFLKSLKVVPFMEEANIASEKVAVTLVVGETPVALAVGTVLMTVGAVVSPPCDEFAMNFEGMGAFFRHFCYFRKLLRVGSEFCRERDCPISRDLSRIGPDQGRAGRVERADRDGGERDMQDPASELPRIHIPHTPVNKACYR